MTRNQLEPITVGGLKLKPLYHGVQIAINVDYGSAVLIPLTSAPAVANAILTLAREMGADVPDADAVIWALVEALNDEAAFLEPPAQAALAAARAYLEGR